MKINERKIKDYIKNNPDVLFDNYLKEILKNKESRRVFNEEGAKIKLAIELYKLRIKKKITQVGLAKQTKIPQSNIARIESCEHMPNIVTLIRITKALGEDLFIKIGNKSIKLTEQYKLDKK